MTPIYHYLLTESLVVEVPFLEIPVTKLNIAIVESQCIAIRGYFITSSRKIYSDITRLEVLIIFIER